MTSETSDVLFSGLNPAQREAVAEIDRPLLVLAGAGSGKTRVITRRIANLIRHGVPSNAILGVTFTNRAAREMRHRVIDLTGDGGVRLSTFHSFSAAFLRDEFPTIGRSGAFTIYDEGDSLVLVRRIIGELNLDPESHKPEALRGKFSTWKNDLVTPKEAFERSRRSIDEQIATAYEAYDRSLREANACDFDDLLVQAHMLLESNSDIRTRWNERLSHVLVDEFQDTNTTQYAIVRLLTQSHGHLCVTGDQDQSIYSWRGARVENFDRFLADHPNALIVKLEQNYRSTANILRAASELISKNQHRIPKTLWTEGVAGSPVRVVGFRDDYEEAFAVAEQVRNFISAGVPRREIAILFRTNALSAPIERVFLQQGIPYEVIGGLEFFSRAEVKDLLAYLRFLANPQDLVSLQRIINVPARGIGETTRDQVFALARAQNRSLGDVLRDRESFASLSKRARVALEGFADILRELDANLSGSIAESATRIMEITGYDQYWRDKSQKGGSLDPYQNLGQLVNLARDYDQTTGGTLQQFLAEVALLTDIDQGGADEERVSFMTLHSAKGLEFNVVIIVGVDYDLLPHRVATLDPSGNEEERRLLHVGMTRAREELILTWALTRTRFGQSRPSGPSPFLDEIGHEAVERFGDRPHEQTSRNDPFVGAFHDDVPADLDDDHPYTRLGPSARVWHPEFGQGTVESVRGRSRGLDQKVVVAFDSGGTRTLVLRFANLEVLDS